MASNILSFQGLRLPEIKTRTLEECVHLSFEPSVDLLPKDFTRWPNYAISSEVDISLRRLLRTYMAGNKYELNKEGIGLEENDKSQGVVNALSYSLYIEKLFEIWLHVYLVKDHGRNNHRIREARVAAGIVIEGDYFYQGLGQKFDNKGGNISQVFQRFLLPISDSLAYEQGEFRSAVLSILHPSADRVQECIGLMTQLSSFVKEHWTEFRDLVQDDLYLSVYHRGYPKTNEHRLAAYRAMSQRLSGKPFGLARKVTSDPLENEFQSSMEGRLSQLSQEFLTYHVNSLLDSSKKDEGIITSPPSQ